MVYKSLSETVKDLEKHGHLVRITEEVEPNLEMAALQRRIFAQKGPALLFERVAGSPFPAVSNLFGTMERARFIFRSTLESVKRLVRFRAEPDQFLRSPLELLRLPPTALNALPRRARRNTRAIFKETTISQLPAIRAWPLDGGPFITLGQIFSVAPDEPQIMKSNLGMYRIQMSGNSYRRDEQIGLHYQIHRGIGVHHARAIALGKPLRVSIFVGGPPAHTFAAVMPLPEGLPEAAFAGALAGRPFRYLRDGEHFLSADADFCITGTIEPELLPEGPFGDHLGYYSLTHDFPALRVEKVYHRPGAIWPFTVVGRPPQEDTIFGNLIHEITGPMVPASIPGLKAMHAVDAAGVHPLLLAIGSERYRPYAPRKPEELLTIANAILGFGQASLAKYLLIIAQEDAPDLDIHHIDKFFMHLLERIDWRCDLHFQTNTTMDTLDYSGTGINEGSRVVMAAAGEARRRLSTELSGDLAPPASLKKIRVVLPGVVALEGSSFQPEHRGDIKEIVSWVAAKSELFNGFPLLLLVDDAEFVARNLSNFLWTTFTRSNPSHDIHGVDEFIEHKHWGCNGPLLIDARIKPHHAPPLEDDPNVIKRIERLGEPGGSLHKIL